MTTTTKDDDEKTLQGILSEANGVPPSTPLRVATTSAAATTTTTLGRAGTAKARSTNEINGFLLSNNGTELAFSMAPRVGNTTDDWSPNSFEETLLQDIAGGALFTPQQQTHDTRTNGGQMLLHDVVGGDLFAPFSPPTGDSPPPTPRTLGLLCGPIGSTGYSPDAASPGGAAAVAVVATGAAGSGKIFMNQTLRTNDDDSTAPPLSQKEGLKMYRLVTTEREADRAQFEKKIQLLEQENKQLEQGREQDGVRIRALEEGRVQDGMRMGKMEAEMESLKQLLVNLGVEFPNANAGDNPGGNSANADDNRAADPTNNQGVRSGRKPGWTDQENEKMDQMIKDGTSWPDILKELPGRNEDAVRLCSVLCPAFLSFLFLTSTICCLITQIRQHHSRRSRQMKQKKTSIA